MKTFSNFYWKHKKKTKNKFRSLINVKPVWKKKNLSSLTFTVCLAKNQKKMCFFFFYFLNGLCAATSAAVDFLPCSIKFNKKVDLKFRSHPQGAFAFVFVPLTPWALRHNWLTREYLRITPLFLLVFRQINFPISHFYFFTSKNCGYCVFYILPLISIPFKKLLFEAKICLKKKKLTIKIILPI